MSYIGNTPGVSSQRVVLETVVSGSPQSVFTPISGYTLGYVDVLVNGVEVDSADFTAADGVTVTLATAAAVGDTVKIKTWLPRGLSDGYLKSEADARYLKLTGGTLTGSLEFNLTYPYLNNITSGSVKPMLAINTAGTYYAGLFDSGVTGSGGSKQYFARTTSVGGTPGDPILAIDYQNNRVGIGTITPAADLDVQNPNGSGTTLRVKARTSGVVALNLDSFSNSGGGSTQIGFLLNNAAKWAFGYANIGAGGADDMGIYNYINSTTPWLMTSGSYQRLPKTAAFMATISANYISSGVSVVNFNTTTAAGCFDNRGNFDTGNYRFVAPVDGWYQFNVAVNQYSISGTYFEISLRKNGSTSYAGGRIYSGGSSDQNITTTAVLYLSQNDYVDVVSQQAGGFSANVRWNTFSGHLIG